MEDRLETRHCVNIDDPRCDSSVKSRKATSEEEGINISVTFLWWNVLLELSYWRRHLLPSAPPQNVIFSRWSYYESFKRILCSCNFWTAEAVTSNMLNLILIYYYLLVWDQAVVPARTQAGKGQHMHCIQALLHRFNRFHYKASSALQFYTLQFLDRVSLSSNPQSQVATQSTIHVLHQQYQPQSNTTNGHCSAHCPVRQFPAAPSRVWN